MSGDDSQKGKVEILEPRQRVELAHLDLDDQNFRVAVFRRLSIYGVRKVSEEYLLLANVKAELVEAGTRLKLVEEEYHKVSKRLENLPAILKEEEKNVLAELKMNAMRRDMEIEEIQFQKKISKLKHKKQLFMALKEIEKAQNPSRRDRKQGGLGKEFDDLHEAADYLVDVDELVERFCKEESVDREEDLKKEIHIELIRRARELVETHGS